MAAPAGQTNPRAYFRLAAAGAAAARTPVEWRDELRLEAPRRLLAAGLAAFTPRRPGTVTASPPPAPLPRATLSSARTPFLKIAYPIALPGLFASATLFMFLSPPPDLPARLPWVFLFFTVAGSVFIWWIYVPLKRVRMDDRALYISNYMKEIVVPLSNVAELTESWWLSDHPVTIRFHSATEFGSHIVFTPKLRWFGAWSSHPVVAEIRGAVARGRAAGAHHRSVSSSSSDSSIRVS